MAKEEIIKRSIEISEIFDEMATKVFENAKVLLKEDSISYREYKEIMDNYYLPLMNYSSKILIDKSNEIVETMEDYVSQILRSTEELKKVSKKLKKSEEIFGGIVFILASAASIATFTVAPSPISFYAAISTISTSIEKLDSLT